MIPFANFDNFEKYPKAAPESAETDSSAEDFASFLIAPASFRPPVNNLPAQAQPESEISLKTVETSSQTGDQLLPVKAETNAKPENPSPPNPASEDSSLNEASETPFEKSANLEKANFEIFAGRQKFIAVEGAPTLRETLRAPLNKEIFSSETPSKIAETQNFSPADLPPAEEALISGGETRLFSGSEKSAQVTGAGAETAAFSKGSLNLFGEGTGVFKTPDAPETEAKLKRSDFLTAATAAAEQVLAESSEMSGGFEANVSEKTPENPNQPEPETPASDTENFSGSVFDKFLAAASKEWKAGETALPNNSQSEKVLAQIEPRILELAALPGKAGDKRILKMRLNPAELGGVEITLEKNASGKIDAHFQTENETARQILTASLDQLRDSLQNSGWQVGDLEISCTNPFSSTGGTKNGENQSPGTVDGQTDQRAKLDSQSETIDDSKETEADRLVSLRA